MTTTQPPITSSSRPGGGLSPDPVDARVAMLRAELEAATDRAHKAAIQYELGHVTEVELGQEAQAVREYLAAYNLDPSFAPPLVALVRIFERRRSFKNLARLYEAETKSAASPEERASSLVDRAVLAEDQLGSPDAARALYEQAIVEHPEGAALPALFLERLLLARGERDAATDAIATRAAQVADPTLKGMLLIEVARGREERGDVDGAIEAARQAATLPSARFRFLEQLERIARRHARVPEIVAALEGRAALAARAARGEAPAGSEGTAGSGAFSIKRFADEARAAGEAAALYREAARIRMLHLRSQDGTGDAQGALAALGKAILLRSGDLALHRDRMLAAELAGDLVTAADEARRLLAAGVEGRHAAPLHFRVAEEAQARGETDEARAALAAALEADPRSAVVAAMLEDLSVAGAQAGDGRLEGWIARLGARAESSEGALRARLAWQAAHLAATRTNDAERACALYATALDAAAEDTKATLAREWLGASLRLGHATGARDAAKALLEQPIDDEERSAILRDLHELERMVLEDDAAADATLDRALQTSVAAWAPDAARVLAAMRGDGALLARAHRKLAERAADADAAAAHLCAAARALVRVAASREGGLEASRTELEEAATLLADALQRVPGHRYAVALLEEVYRARGDADAVVKLLREAAEADRAGRAMETQLLLAGAAAEAAGDHALARRTYEEAAERDPSAIGPLFALRRLAELREDDALLRLALERLSEVEVGAGAPGRATLEVGEHLQLVAKEPSLAEPALRLALGVADLAAPAALDLALMGPASPASMLDGTRELVTRAEGDARLAWRRELGGVQLDLLGETAAAEAIADEILGASPDEPWALLAKLRATSSDPARAADRAAAMLALADATSDADASADLVVHGLRVAALAGQAADDAILRAVELEEARPGSFAAAALGLEALSEADDPGERADALGRWAAHASTESARAIHAARARALAAAARGAEACDALREALAGDPEDLASWEALRVAARDAERWMDVVEACDRLAAQVDGALRATLLEEAAAVLMDQTDPEDAEALVQAERRLREALEIDGGRAIAYGRLHDLLAERGDDAGLLELVQARADRTDDPEQLSPLFYELARLHRGLGRRDDALVSLDNLLMLEPEHVGGLALLVELHVQREAWPEAVQALRTLAGASDVPASQRRIARLGAADFLDKKLSQPLAAADELEAIEGLGLADRALFERIADLCERGGRVDRAVQVLAKAAAAAREPAQRAAAERRAARLWDERLGDEDQAIAAYRRALEAVPTDVEAGAALAVLLDGPSRIALSTSFERSVREVLDADPTEPEALRMLATAARWRGDKVLETAVLGALVAIDLATEDEREQLGEDTEVLRRVKPGATKLTEARLTELMVSGVSGPVMELALLATETLTEMDRLEPSSFGMGRGELLRDPATSPAAQEVLGISMLLGAPAGDVWAGGRDPQLLAVIPSYKGKPAWLLGGGVGPPLTSLRRYEIGRSAIALRLGLGPFVTRSVDATATALFAIASAAGAPLPVGEGRAGMADATRAANKAMSRRVRKAAPEAIAKIAEGGRPVLAFASALHASFARAGLVVAGDLHGVLATVLGRAPERDAVRANASALDLLRFWISPAAITTRRELGLAS
ncbi:hypothetical protein [Sandaracinus amylolyticus]|uniref:Exonuclease SbcC n=1 Tax=Sandaracinus amylolyticus TaxID=927083 RepID=A0A0F6SG77_9BACT|nr:hypothetical protein [Sandaracinus amylolyticus]AKF08214.1 Exonuclease SbcC [Sandaracinus amylolyticus]